MSPSQFARVPGFVGSPLAAMNPKLLQGRVGQMLPPAPGFRAFFSAPPPATPPPPQQHPPGPGPHLQNLRYTEKCDCPWSVESLDCWRLVIEGSSLLAIFKWCILRCYLILKLPNTEMLDGLQGFIWITFPSSHVLPGLPRWLSDKELPASAGEVGSIPGSERSPGEGNGNPFQDSCLRNPMDRGAWWATVLGIAKSRAQFSN